MVTYPTRYSAYKEKKYGEVVVKVEGGYAVMDAGYYYGIWRKQK